MNAHQRRVLRRSRVRAKLAFGEAMRSYAERFAAYVGGPAALREFLFPSHPLLMTGAI